jgi:CxxC-x17-CxxC domain-containing protein
MEKFPIICSFCKLEKTVPFKPEPGRAAYCKECIAKIKSGEVKVEKRGQDQIKYDESKFYKPLADLGIEFQQAPVATKPAGIIKTFKKVFAPKQAPAPIRPKTVYPARPSVAPAKRVNIDNSALREVLNKVVVKSQDEQTLPTKVGTPTGVGAEPISLDSLKNKMQDIKKPISPVGVDRAATAEDMNKLKDLIEKKVFTPPSTSPVASSVPIPTPVPQKPATKEVPEDVLRKILE